MKKRIRGDKLAVKIKASQLIKDSDLKGVKALREDGLIKNYAIVSRDSESRIVEGVKIYPWKMFLEKLWQDALI